MSSGKSISSENIEVINLFLRIWNHLPLKRRIQLIFLFNLMLISGLAEAFSMASVMPFLSILSNPQKINTNPIIQSFTNFFQINTDSQILLYTTTFFCCSILISTILKLINLRFNTLMGAWIGSDISTEAFRRNLYQPYKIHLKNNSSKVISELAAFTFTTTAFLNYALLLFTNSFISIFVLLALFSLSFKTALTIGSIFLIAYSMIALKSNKLLVRNSKLIASKTEDHVKITQEGLGAIRDLILDNTREKYLSKYNSTDVPLRIKQADNNFISSSPKFILEALVIIVIVLMGYLVTSSDENVSTVIPVLGLLALGAQRLLPAFHQSYFAWSGMKARVSLVNRVMASLEKTLSPSELSKNIKPLTFNNSIELNNVCYKYDTRDKFAINNINFLIKKGERIGLIGSTGSGKTTLIDVLIGLLEPTVGNVYVDKKNIYQSNESEFISSWRQSISHVPQNIYLTDNSIAENIAFIHKKEQIDFSRIKRSAKMANVHNFIDSLPMGYETIVGERGLKLSGGQMQRIGIARAFYKGSKILVFDEATSALDNKTEISVMNSINNFSKEITLIIVAHRLSTVKKCDKIIRLEEGLIKEIGDPKDIL